MKREGWEKNTIYKLVICEQIFTSYKTKKKLSNAPVKFSFKNPEK